MNITKRWICCVCLLLGAASPPLLRSEISKAPDDGLPEAIERFNEGYDLLVKEKYSEAASKFEVALQLHERFAQAHNNLAFALRMQGPAHYEPSLTHYNRAIELSPRLAEPYAYRGTLYVLMGKNELAMKDYEKLRILNQGLAEELLVIIKTGAENKGGLLNAASKKIYKRTPVAKKE